MICNLCSSDTVYLLYRLPQGYKIMACRKCGLRFLHPILSEENLHKIYEKGYFEPWGINSGQIKYLKSLKELSYESILKEVEKFIIPGSFLDVGCAFGYSFEVAMRRGWDSYGVEISPEAYRTANDKFSSKVVFGDFSRVELDNNSFDLVVMLDFLEHVSSLTDTMTKAYNILKPKGLIAVVTPDIDSLSAQLMHRNWTHIKLEHVFYLSRRALKSLFIKTGFKPILFKSFWKPVNFLYFKGQVKKYGPRYQSLILKLLERFIPNYIRRLNIFIPQGEILALAEKV